jgi:DnaJ like chaperone protein
MNLLKFSLGKIIGCLAGAAAGGFIGLIIGFVVGAIVDKLHKEGGRLWLNNLSPDNSGEMDPNDFVVGSVLMAAAVVKSDGKVEELELSYVRSFLVEQFGTLQMQNYWQILMQAIEKDFDLKKTTREIRKSTSYETRLQLVHFLFGIANADYKIDEIEIATVKVISIHLGINATEFNSIKAMFYHEIDASYKILGLTPSASDFEVQQAYHNMCIKYHPDKLEYLGQGVMNAGKAKFLKVKQAFENIKTARGIK